MKQTLKIGISGVRGIVGQSFSPQLASTFAQALGTFVGPGEVLVGRDTRPSGGMIEQAVMAGLLSVGCKPVLLGIVPTPSLLYMVRHRNARGGIMITASHNASEWNALKFIDRRGMFFGAIHAEELFDIYHQQDFPYVYETELRTTHVLEDAVGAHFERITSFVDAAAIRAAGFRVAVDCCNGVGALHSRAFLEQHLNAQVVSIHDTPNGMFEREPEPLAEHLDALATTVTKHQCAVGFAQDPDGDRLAVIDEKGRPIGEEITVALALRAVLTLHQLGPVAVNLSAGKSVEKLVESCGGQLTRTKTGEVHVCEAMERIGAVAGGEHTGGIIVPAIHPCRESFAGMALILELMARTGESISALCESIPRYSLIKERMPISSDQAPTMLRVLRQTYADYPMSFLDGVYIDLGDRWVHVRRSNTEPVLRIIAEAPTPAESEALIREVRERLIARESAS